MHYCLRAPDGAEMWGRWRIREISQPERLVFVNSFSNKEGGIARFPMKPNWPLEILSTIAFVEQAGHTLLTVEWAPLNPTEAERKNFDESREDMGRGWGGSLDKLAEQLAAA
jgi:uncharacterized protein YndB with AHSA1/START domain